MDNIELLFEYPKKYIFKKNRDIEKVEIIKEKEDLFFELTVKKKKIKKHCDIENISEKSMIIRINDRMVEIYKINKN
jgi:hypothetical protein